MTTSQISSSGPPSPAVAQDWSDDDQSFQEVTQQVKDAQTTASTQEQSGPSGPSGTQGSTNGSHDPNAAPADNGAAPGQTSGTKGGIHASGQVTLDSKSPAISGQLGVNVDQRDVITGSAGVSRNLHTAVFQEQLGVAFKHQFDPHDTLTGTVSTTQGGTSQNYSEGASFAHDFGKDTVTGGYTHTEGVKAKDSDTFQVADQHKWTDKDTTTVTVGEVHGGKSQGPAFKITEGHQFRHVKVEGSYSQNRSGKSFGVGFTFGGKH